MKSNSVISLQWALYLIIGCLTFVSHAQSKITLKEFDDPAMSGYKSIVFEYEEDDPNSRSGKRTVTKEFDVEANNPFLKFGNVDKIERNQYNYTSKSKIESYLNDHDFSKLIISDEESNKLVVTSSVKKAENQVIVAYRASITNGDDVVLNSSVSSFIVFDKTGQKLIDKEIERWVGDIEISANSHFVVYDFNKYGAHSMLEEVPGFTIWNIADDVEVLTKSATVNVIYSSGQFITISVYENGVKYLYLLDSRNGSIYRKELPTSSIPSLKVINNESLKIGSQVFSIINLQKIK